MLAVNRDTVRLFLHVLAATIWVGGQLVLAALVPVLRRFCAEVPRAAASRFNQVDWVAFTVLIVTGVWNIIAVRGAVSHDPGYRPRSSSSPWWSASPVSPRHCTCGRAA